jgi:hypothetical protein
VDNKFLDGKRSVLSWFFKYVAWSSLRHLVQDLFEPTELRNVKENLERLFFSAVETSMQERDNVEALMKTQIDGLAIFKHLQAWMVNMLGTVINEYAATIIHYFNDAVAGDDDLVEYVENAMVLHAFDLIFWKFIHDMVLMNSHMPLGSIAEIKEKLMDQLRHFLDGDITLKEVKRAAGDLFTESDLDSDIACEIISAYASSFYETISNIDATRLHEFIEGFSMNHGTYLDHASQSDTNDSDSKTAVLSWFQEDVVSASIKSIAELFPELTAGDIQEWKGTIVRDLDLSLQSLLSFDDFEKRLLARLKIPKLEFDIEKPIDEKDVEDHFFHIDDRSGSIETILASAEMIYQESRKDAMLKDLAARIMNRKKALDKMYM